MQVGASKLLSFGAYVYPSDHRHNQIPGVSRKLQSAETPFYKNTLNNCMGGKKWGCMDSYSQHWSNNPFISFASKIRDLLIEVHQLLKDEINKCRLSGKGFVTLVLSFVFEKNLIFHPFQFSDVCPAKTLSCGLQAGIIEKHRCGLFTRAGKKKSMKKTSVL